MYNVTNKKFYNKQVLGGFVLQTVFKVLGLSVFGCGLGFRSRFGKGFGHGLPGLARIVDRRFGNQS